MSDNTTTLPFGGLAAAFHNQRFRSRDPVIGLRFDKNNERNPLAPLIKILFIDQSFVFRYNKRAVLDSLA